MPPLLGSSSVGWYQDVQPGPVAIASHTWAGVACSKSFLNSAISSSYLSLIDTSPSCRSCERLLEPELEAGGVDLFTPDGLGEPLAAGVLEAGHRDGAPLVVAARGVARRDGTDEAVVGADGDRVER